MNQKQFIRRVCSPIASFNSSGIPNRYKAALENILMDVWNEEEIKDDVKRIHALTQESSSSPTGPYRSRY